MGKLQKKDKIDLLCFEAKVHKAIYSSENFKVYAMEVDNSKYKEVKTNTYGNVSICGDIPVLSSTLTYEITAYEEEGKYGTSYQVMNIKTDTPTTDEDTRLFLSELLTEKQTEEICGKYPNILNIIKEGRESEVDIISLKGIGKITFDKIVSKIKENFALLDLVAEFKGKLSLSIIKRIFETYSHPDVFKKKLRENPYKCLCSLGRVGFKTADSILLDLEKDKEVISFDEPLISSVDRCLGYIVYLLSENETNGNTYMNMMELKELCDKGISKASHHFPKALQDESLIYNKETLRVAFKKTYNTEKYISDRIKDGLDVNNVWDIDIDKYKDIGEFKLSDEQSEALKRVCDKQISLLVGFAGSGKTFSVQSLISLLEDNNKSFMLMSPTGRASKVLASYTDRICTTIHRGLKFSPAAGFSYNEDNPLDVDIVIVDEASMIDIWLMKALVSAVDFNRTKLLLIGDPAQLPSVGCGNILHDMNTNWDIPKSVLTKVFRYAEGGLMKVATDTRNCKIYMGASDKPIVLGNNRDYIFLETDTEKVEMKLIKMYKQILSEGYSPEDIMVLTPKNIGDTGTRNINRFLQPLANPTSRNGVNFIQIGDNKYFTGDIVMQTRNNYDLVMADEEDNKSLNDDILDDNMLDDTTSKSKALMIPNGETGVIESIKGGQAVIRFGEDKVIYTKSDFMDIQLGYCYTVHKSQGGSAKIVILITTRSDTFMLNSNLIYVGLTRTKERCYHIGNVKTINRAIKKKANLQRNTMLGSFLKSN